MKAKKYFSDLKKGEIEKKRSSYIKERCYPSYGVLKHQIPHISTLSSLFNYFTKTTQIFSEKHSFFLKNKVFYNQYFVPT